MEVYFHRVEIAIEAKDPKAAYDKLCDLLLDNTVEWTTDTFTTEHCDQEFSTEELFPLPGDSREIADTEPPPKP